MPKLLIIGLDCCTPQFVFDAWRSDLPNLCKLMDTGIFGELESSIPPITVPAWTSMLSSKDPGQLGFYGFRNRKSYQYEELYFANASFVKEKMVWNYLDEGGLRSILLGVPQTFPPKPLNGIMVGCFLTPGKSSEYTYPLQVKEDLDRIADGDYIIDVKDFRTNDKDRLLHQLYLMTQRRFKVVRHYVTHEPWDFFMFVEMGIDRIHHGFWRYQDQGHRLHEPGGPYEDAIRHYYRYVDREIGELLNVLEPDTSVMVVSDHGAKRMEGAVCINEWLMREGHLTLKNIPNAPVQLKTDMIDWDKTRVWGEGGYYSRIFFNVQGREPHGVIPQSEYEDFRDRLKAALEALPDEEGRPLGTRVFKPEEVYRSVRNIAPDLIVYFGNLSWRAAGTVGSGKTYLYMNDTGPDDSNHAQHGIFIFKTDSARLTEAGYTPGQKVDGLTLYDIAPSILDHFGLSIPPDMIGRSVLKGTAAEGAALTFNGDPHAEADDYSEEDADEIRKRLEELGYL